MKTKTKYLLYSILTIIIGLIINTKAVNAISQDKNLVNIYFFHSNDCSHCKSEIKLLDDLENRYSNIKVYHYEIYEQGNNEKLKRIQELYRIKTNGVPLTIIGDTYYLGYQEEKSSIKFIKTIEYYSKYGYEDKVGELLQIDNIPIYKIEENIPSLEEFTENYGNYQLIGNLYTNDIDLSLNAIILGILSQLNISKILAILLGLILISTIKSQKDKLLLLTGYFGILFIGTTTSIFSNDLYTLIIEIIILIIYVSSLMKYSKIKSKQAPIVNILIIITIISIYLERYLFCDHHLIYKELMNLHNLSGFNKINYYFNYIFTIIITNFLMILIFYYIIKKLKKDKYKRKDK